MKKKVTVGALLIVAMVCLLAGTLYAKPADCWYTGNEWIGPVYTICDLCYIYYGNAPNPDAHCRDVYWEYQCPDGSTGWDYAYTIVVDCYYDSGCLHSR